MSRIGKKPIEIPAGVDVQLDGTLITVKGPKGTLREIFIPISPSRRTAALSTSPAPTTIR